MRSKWHDGDCSLAFDANIGGKCKVCGEYKKFRVRCAFPVCNNKVVMGHICGRKNLDIIYD